MLMVSPTVGAYGKVPSSGDFVQLGQFGSTASRFRDALHVAIESDRHGKFEKAQPERAFAFCFRDPMDQLSLLVGAIRPSRDAVGRHFPLAIYAVCEGRPFASCPELVPLVLGSFCNQAQAALLAPGENTLDDLGARVAALPPPPSDLSRAATAHRSSLSNTGLLGFWNDVFGSVSHTSLGHALAVIDGAVEPWRGQELPPTPLSLRLPLGRQGTAAVAFWLDVVKRLAGWRQTIPTAFWRTEQPTSVLIQLGEPVPSSLLDLWAPDPDSDYVCDLTTLPETGLAPNAQLSDLLSRTHTETTCWDFVDGLHAKH